jgi:hypothetical protein
MSSQLFRVITVSDPAIDHAACDLSTYVSERDESVLRFVEGEAPTVYVCRPLTLQERRDVRNKATEADRYEAAFVRGLVRVERLLHPDEQRRDWVRPDDKSGKQKPIPDSALELYFSEASIQEVGMVILMKSFLAKGSGHFYPLPDISRHALTATLYRHVVQTNDSATQPSASGSSPQEAPPPETPAP